MDNIAEPTNNTHEHILAVAEKLFSARGYHAVSLLDIASEVGMRKASLYYYVPKGKEQLYIQVMERALNRHHQNLEQMMAEAGPELGDKLKAAAICLLEKPPFDPMRVQLVDLPALDAAASIRISEMAVAALVRPIQQVLEGAAKAGEIEFPDLEIAAHAFVSLIESLHGMPGSHTRHQKRQMAEFDVDLLLNGLRKR